MWNDPPLFPSNRLDYPPPLNRIEIVFFLGREKHAKALCAGSFLCPRGGRAQPPYTISDAQEFPKECSQA